MLLVLTGGAAWWASSDGSLERALRIAAGMLPEGQSLEYREVRGSITGGGRIAYLRWSRPGTAVTLEELRLRWSLGELFNRALHVRELSARRAHVRLTPQTERPEDDPFTMPQELTLPIQLSLPLRLQRLEVETGVDGATSTRVLDGLVASYSYDHVRHSLALESLRSGDSSVRGAATLGARDLALVADFEAALQNLVPDVPLAMRMQLAANGNLSGGDAARVDLRLDAVEQPPAASARAAIPAQLQLQATLHPWRDQPVQSLLLESSGINAHAFAGAAPVTAIGGSVQVTPSGERAWNIRLDFTNRNPGPLDEQRLPLDRLVGEASITPARWFARSLRLEIGGGSVRVDGEFDPQTRALQVQGDIDSLRLRPIHRQLAAENGESLSGSVSLAGDLKQGLSFTANVNGKPVAGRGRARWEIRSVQARGRWSSQLLSLERLDVSALHARVTGRDIEVGLPDFVPVRGTINADAPGFTVAAYVDGSGRAGTGTVSLRLNSAQEAVTWLRGLPVLGADIPALSATGSALVQGRWNGAWPQWLRALKDPASQAGLGADVNVSADALTMVLPPAESGGDPLRMEVRNLDAALAGNFSAAQLTIAGVTRLNGSAVTLDASLGMARPARAALTAWNFTIARFTATASLPGQEQAWNLRITNGLRIGLNLGNTLRVEAGAGQATLRPPADGSSEEEALTLSWEPLQWQRSSKGVMRVSSRGNLRGLRPGWIDKLMSPTGDEPLASAGLYSTLVLDGDWDIQMSDELAVHAKLRRDSGDLWLGSPENPVEGAPSRGTQENTADRVRREGVAAGVRTLDLVAQSRGEDISAALEWNTERAGVISANLRTSLSRAEGGWRLAPEAPLAGSIDARIQELGVWGLFAPPGWRVQGELHAGVTLDGTLQEPRARGTLEGRGLNLRSVLDGVDLHDGVLRASLQGQRLLIEEFTIQGGTGSRAHVRGISGNRSPPSGNRGSMTVRGSIDWSGIGNAGVTGSGIDMDVRAELQRMQVLVRNDRQVTLSGDLSAGLADGALQVRGDLAVDRAAIMLPESRAPTLGRDVVVHRNSEPAAAARQVRGQLQTARPMDLQIRIDLGNDLALQGYGITTRLEGDVTVSSGTADNPFLVVGEVRTDEGRFRAWGQALNVETGSLLFNGPYDNPSLDMLAIRPEIEVRAGVRITGTAQAPRVALYSEPELPEAEKLSWVVMGRASVGGGTAEGTSMQQAALGLLAGSVGSGLADDLGLDELGLSDSSVSIGKRISNELYMTYEAGLSGATSTLYLFYDITRRLTARGRTGEDTALDLIYTFTFD